MSRHGFTHRKHVLAGLGLVLLMLAPMAVIPPDILWPKHKTRYIPDRNPQGMMPETKQSPTWEEWCSSYSHQHKQLPFKPLALRLPWEIQQ